MLTADLVRARRTKEGDLQIRGVHPKARDRLVTVARAYVAAAKEGVGQPREAFDDACAQVPVHNSDVKVAEGLLKLVTDRCDFSADDSVDPPEIRAAVFARAAEARREGEFDRDAVLAEVASTRGTTVEALEAAMYSDLRQAHLMRGFDPPDPEALVDGYDLAQAQAVLLRATRVVAHVRCERSTGYSRLFRKLKFRRLLHTLHPHEDGGYRLVIEGPFDLFKQSTKYGLQLALMLPAIAECDAWAIDAQVRWGKDKARLRFQLDGARAGADEDDSERLPDEVAELKRRFEKLDAGWKVRSARRIIDLPGVGQCFPDLVFSLDDGRKVYLEVLGYWSREAVWRRVDLVEAGLETPILFAVSSRLRVSEAVLGDDLPGSLYVYKGAMSARAVAERLARFE